MSQNYTRRPRQRIRRKSLKPGRSLASAYGNEAAEPAARKKTELVDTMQPGVSIARPHPHAHASSEYGRLACAYLHNAATRTAQRAVHAHRLLQSGQAGDSVWKSRFLLRRA
eukprot:6214741-Pleurochrysis_carterae.AAC.5